jgi:transcriptional regulator with XRE-family HTH domain
MNICYYQTMATCGTDLLLHHYLDWQKSEGHIKTLKDFAAFCGINESYLNLVMNGKRPLTQKMALKLAQILHDPKFYDALDLPRPDPDLQALSCLWPSLSSEARHTLREQGEKYVTENEQSSTRSRPMEKAS